MERSESIKNLAGALAKAQGQIRGAAKNTMNANPFIRKKYADLDSHWDACREALSQNGLSVIQFPRVEGERVVVKTILAHESGEWVSEELAMVPMRQEKEKGWVPSPDPQTIGSAITYLRRYGFSAITGTSPEDDDGNAASGKPSQPEETNQPKGNGSTHQSSHQENKSQESKQASNPASEAEENKKKFVEFMAKFSGALGEPIVLGLLKDKGYASADQVEKFEDQSAIFRSAKVLYESLGKNKAKEKEATANG